MENLKKKHKFFNTRLRGEMINLSHTGLSQTYFQLIHIEEIVSIIKGITAPRHY